MRTARDNKGFVLLLVLLVLAVCGVAMSAAVRRSAQNAMRATAAERQLQVRWGALSCKAAVLPNVEKLLTDRVEQDKPVELEIRQSIVMGGLTFNLIAADESAKANINILAERQTTESLTRTIQRLQDDTRDVLRISLRPDEMPPPEEEKATPAPGGAPADKDKATPAAGKAPTDKDKDKATPAAGNAPADKGRATAAAGKAPTDKGKATPAAGNAPTDEDLAAPGAGDAAKDKEKADGAATPLPTRYVNFDQFVEITHPSQLVSPDPRAGSPLARRMTCWSAGPLNLARAEIPTMRQVLMGILDESNLTSVDDLRRKEKDLAVDGIFRYLQLSAKQEQAARPLVSTSSDCHSLWVVVEGPTRSWYHFYADSASAEGQQPVFSYSW